MGFLLPLFFLFILFPATPAHGSSLMSEATETCVGCHLFTTPGIVADWMESLHAEVTPNDALEKPSLTKQVSADQFPEELADRVVGCAECHTSNPAKHADTFEHQGFSVHVVVTPEDCALCHPAEVKQFAQNIMSRAHGNLKNNPLYHDLAQSINGIQAFQEQGPTTRPPDQETGFDSCYFCHGTAIEVKGLTLRETSLGEMKFPVLSGWPNQGVGRVNPDGSLGSCAACHVRHEFSIEVARMPYTCSTCHKGPDVPAYRVYEVSKHGNIFSSRKEKWDFRKVPWTLGKDFTAPTCAACHISLMVTENDEVVARRSHQMNDRLPWRIMGLIYAHPHPQSPDTTGIRNRAGLPLPTELTGEPAPEGLIDRAEQEKRKGRMEKICLSCHSENWVQNHFRRFENTLRTTNEMTLAATRVLMTAWEKGIAKGPAQQDSPFNEALEKKWVEQWLFFANSTRFASAMAGADYGVFANGRWFLSKNLQDMAEQLALLLAVKKEGAEETPEPGESSPALKEE
jgi:hydroxylamine dehydrogenase